VNHFSIGTPLARAFPHLHPLTTGDDGVGGIHARPHLIEVNIHCIHGCRKVLDWRIKPAQIPKQDDPQKWELNYQNMIF
jgi:hypothetical protein